MHYAYYKHEDPALVGEILKKFPFEAILVNGTKGVLRGSGPNDLQE